MIQSSNKSTICTANNERKGKVSDRLDNKEALLSVYCVKYETQITLYVLTANNLQNPTKLDRNIQIPQFVEHNKVTSNCDSCTFFAWMKVAVAFGSVSESVRVFNDQMDLSEDEWVE